jgi:hypothetical protein
MLALLGHLPNDIFNDIEWVFAQACTAELLHEPRFTITPR